MNVIAPIEDGEIFIGLIGPVGTDMPLVTQCLKAELQRVRYGSSVVRLSDQIRRTSSGIKIPTGKAGEYERINALMDAGDALRQKTKRGDVLALLSVYAVQELRLQLSNEKTSTKPIPRHAYVFHSLKHPDEVRLLRQVYGDQFIAVSVYAHREDRVTSLAQRVARSLNQSDVAKFRDIAEKLIEKDALAEDEQFGQDVRDTFPLADFFVRQGDQEQVTLQVRRLVELSFGYQFHTPSSDEYGMFHARAAALRSADLSRQVGAVLSSAAGELLGTGCNEVPKPGGGIVWTGDDARDHRDFRLGYDTNTRKRQQILEEVFSKLREAKWLARPQASKAASELASDALFSQPFAPLKDTRIASIIEFGRIVHAEMNALMDAARRGVATNGATLYSTTFPCHMCARHIISAGIKRVVYIEPYPKSLAKELYKDELSVDGETASPEAVTFEAFVGVAPRSFIRLFEMLKRKDSKTGDRLEWQPGAARFKIDLINRGYLDSELQIVQYVGRGLKQYVKWSKR